MAGMIAKTSGGSIAGNGNKLGYIVRIAIIRKYFSYKTIVYLIFMMF